MEKQKKALAAVILGNSIFGLSFLFSKVALNITMPSVVLAFRFTFAFVILNIVVFLGKIIKKKDGSQLVSFSLKKSRFDMRFFSPCFSL